MSYIDIVDHDMVGYLAGIPVYHPRGTIKGGDEFDCSPETLVLGGGSGEHPAMVVSNLKALALDYLVESIHLARFSSSGAEAFNEVLAEAKAEAFDESLAEANPAESTIPACRCFHFAQWGADTYADVIQRCSTGVPTPYSRERFHSFENWLALTFGELVFFSFPEFAPTIPEHIRGSMDELTRHGLMWMRNIQVLPAGYPMNGGRRTVGGQTQWGSSAFEVRRRSAALREATASEKPAASAGRSERMSAVQIPIAIHKDEGSVFGVTVPDIPGCHAAGEDLVEAKANARQAIEAHMRTLVETGHATEFWISSVEALRKQDVLADAVWDFVEVDVAVFQK